MRPVFFILFIMALPLAILLTMVMVLDRLSGKKIMSLFQALGRMTKLFVYGFIPLSVYLVVLAISGQQDLAIVSAVAVIGVGMFIIPKEPL